MYILPTIFFLPTLKLFFLSGKRGRKYVLVYFHNYLTIVCTQSSVFKNRFNSTCSYGFKL